MIAGMDQDKRALRAALRARRAQLGSDPDADRVRHVESQALLAAAQQAGLLDPGGQAGAVGPVTITAYVASPGEPEVAGIRAAVRAAGGRVLLPIPRPGRTLAWALDEGDYAEVSALRVLAPTGPPVGTGAQCLIDQAVHLVLVPALAVDLSGTRLGQGGGFYDVLLGELREMARAREPGAQTSPDVVVTVRDDEVLPAGEIPRDAHDVAVRAILTPLGVRRLG